MRGDMLDLLEALGRTTLAVAVAAVATYVLLRWLRVRSAVVHRGACVAVLLVGWLWLRVPVEVPYWVPPTLADATLADATLADATLADATLADATLTDATLADATLADATLADATLADAVDAPPVELFRGPSAVVAEEPSTVVAEEPSPAATTRRDAKMVSIPSVVLRDDAKPSDLSEATGLPAAAAFASSDAEAGWLPAWPAALLGLWIAGMAALLVKQAFCYVWFVARLPRGLAYDPQWQTQWDDVLAAQGHCRAVPLQVTRARGPMLCCIPGGYRLLVPQTLWAGLSPAQRASVLRHEAAHLRRGDVWKSLLVELLALPHWFNPGAWWAVGRFHEAAEWACDAAALGPEGAATADYAKSLLAMSLLPVARARVPYHPAAGGRGLSERISRLVTHRSREDSVMKKLVIFGAALLIVLAFLLRIHLVAKEPPKEPAGGDMSASITSADVDIASPTGKKAAARESLRYDGKSFQQWRVEWRTELKIERRIEAVHAFAEFGRRGYAKEAAEAILEVMREYPIGYPIGDSSGATDNEKLIEAALAYFGGVTNARTGQKQRLTDPEAVVPVLIKELKEGNDSSRCVAAMALLAMTPDAAAAVPALWESAGRGKPSEEAPFLHLFSIHAAIANDKTGEHLVKKLHQALAARDHAAFSAISSSVPFGNDPMIERALQCGLWEIDPESAGMGGTGGGMAGGQGFRLTSKGKLVLAVYLDALADKDYAFRSSVLFALQCSPQYPPGRLSQSEAERSAMVQALIQAFAKTERREEKLLIAGVLGELGPAVKEAAGQMLSDALAKATNESQINPNDPELVNFAQQLQQAWSSVHSQPGGLVLPGPKTEPAKTPPTTKTTPEKTAPAKPSTTPPAAKASGKTTATPPQADNAAPQMVYGGKSLSQWPSQW